MIEQYILTMLGGVGQQQNMNIQNGKSIEQIFALLSQSYMQGQKVQIQQVKEALDVLVFNERLHFNSGKYFI